jgi:hypothetical protein
MSKTRLDAGLDDANLLEPRHAEVTFTMQMRASVTQAPMLVAVV